MTNASKNQLPPFALLASRVLPGKPEPAQAVALPLPRPQHEDPVMEFLYSNLDLPSAYALRCDVAPRGLEPGLQQLWSQDGKTGLHMPGLYLLRHQLDRHTRAKVLLAPNAAGITFDGDLLCDLAWTVLTRMPPEKVVEVAATLAVRTELRAADLSPIVVDRMKFGRALGSRLRTLSRRDEVFLYHDCLRWVVRETAAAVVAGSWSPPVPTPITAGNEAMAARLMFPSLLGSAPPGEHELLRALWVLHCSFKFGDSARIYSESHDEALSMMTAMAMGQPQWGAWAIRLERWLHMIETPDSDPAVATQKLSPTRFGTLFSQAVGLSASEWIAMMWVLAMRYMAMVMSSTGWEPLALPIRMLLRITHVPLSARFESALRANAVADLPTLGAAVLADLKGPYGGLGTLPAAEGVALRNAPLVEIAPGRVVPVGLHLLGERGVTLPRLVVGKARTSGGVREVDGTLGKMFEARVRDVAVRASPRHPVLTGDQINAVVPAKKGRCDIVIVDTDHWLLVEVGLQTLPVGVGLGQPPSIKDKCTKYHEKADQADATREHMAALADRYGLIPPTGASILVVSDVVPHTVPLVGELRRQRPRRSPLFVANFDEFELLITGGAIWSIPRLIWRWQERQEPVPLLAALAEAQELARIPRPEPVMDPKTWADILGVSSVA